MVAFFNHTYSENLNMKRELPIYEARINEAEGMDVNMISIVATPAVTTNNKEVFGEGNFLKFSDSEKVDKLHFSSDEKMQLFGIAMMPNEWIYRKDKKTNEEFYIVFTPEEVETIAIRFAKAHYNNNVNVEHSKRDAKSVVFESYIVDSGKGKLAPAVFGEVPNGTWMVGVQVYDINLWQEIKEGKRTGFSVEGLFQLIDRDVFIEVDFTNDNNQNDIEIAIDGWNPKHDNSELKSLFNQYSNYLKYLNSQNS